MFGLLGDVPPCADHDLGWDMTEGTLKDGVYQFDNVVVPKCQSSSFVLTAFYTQCTSFDIWHQRLGHPSYRTMDLVLS